MTDKALRPTNYARHRYSITAPIDFDVAMNYGLSLMSIAGGDGELADSELQWYLDEQDMLFENPDEYIAALRKADWRSANLEQLLGGIRYDFALNARRTLLYQAIKMCRADQDYHAKERETVRRAAEFLGIEQSVVTSIECVVALEESTERLRLSLFEADTP